MMIDVENRPLRPAHVPALRYEDPLDADEEDDVVVITTRRALLRLALVATETASRLSREGAATDPMAWMLAPKRLFDGGTAIEACLEREGCMRAIVLHGLGMGMDAAPDEIDELYDDEDDDGSFDVDAGTTIGGKATSSAPRLWTSYLVEGTDTAVLHAFDAVVASDRHEAEARLRARHGAAALDADLMEGFDAGLPLAEALVSPALADMLGQVALDPASPLASGLSVSIRQRFAA